MSKIFAAIRYHGNAEAGVRHTKRGMYELFVAQDLQKRMEVPIYKRTVEVNEYTTITVQIAMEQTFVHIYSNPPSLPEVVLPPPEKEMPEPFGCPSAFIIRSQLDHGSPEQKHNGYVIAYNHLTSRWSVATFKDKYGNTVPEAANLGWYHAKGNTSTGVYNHCDVVTWKGQSGPTFQPTASSIDIFVTSKLYFQGRKFDGPGNPILGACILEEADGTDYMYAHTGSYTDTGATSQYHTVSDRFYRKKLSSFLAGTGSWESLGLLKTAEGSPDWLVSGYLTPRSTDYIDEFGYAYIVREYIIAEPPVYSMSGITRYMKVNMRDGAAEILNTSQISAPVVAASAGPTNPDHEFIRDSRGGWGPWIAFQHWGAGTLTGNNLENPWIFYVFPGTQDLYTLGLEHTYTHSSYGNTEVYPEGGARPTFMSSGSTTSTMITFKNGKSIDRWELNYSHYNYADVAAPKPIGIPASGIAGACSTKTTWLIEYHPEMPKNKIYIEYTVTESGSNDVTLYKDDTKINLGHQSFPNSIPIPKNIGEPKLPYVVPTSYYAFGVSPGVIANIEDGFKANALGINHLLMGDVSFQAEYPNRNAIHIQNSSVQMYDYIGVADVFPFWGPSGTAPGFRYGIKIGSGAQTHNKITQTEAWGSVYDFVLKDRVGDDPSSGSWMVDAYAIHRPVGGGSEKPYLRLRRDLEPGTGFYNIAPGIADHMPSFNEDTRIIMSDEDPGFFGPGTNPYGEVLGTFNRQRLVWSRPPGSLRDLDEDPDNETTHWNDKDWELLSNFTSADLLNAMTKEIGNAFFNIGIM